MPDVSSYAPFGRLLSTLADLFAAEGRPGGDEAAEALRTCARKELRRPVPPHPLMPVCKAAIATAPHPAATAVGEAMRYIAWHYSGLEDGRIPPEIARSLVTAELIGPNGHVHHPTVRAGLFVQSSALDYVTRFHAAEETFVMLGGSGLWYLGDEPGVSARAGDYIHHPSNIPHKSVTTDEPLIAAWRWTGEISYGKYVLPRMATA